MTPENKVYRLPDYYNKKTGSNNWKILELQYQGVDLLNQEIELVRTASDVTKATGKALDVWGDIEGIKRNGLDDEAYRAQILIQIARDMISVDYTSWYQTVLNTFGRTSEEIVVSGTGNPYEYQFDKFPLDAVTAIGLDINTATSLIEAILPLTGELLEILYDGGTPAYITAYIGSVIGQSFNTQLSNDITSDEEIYINPRVLIAADGEIYEDCEGNFGRDKNMLFAVEPLTAGTVIGCSMVLILQDVVIKEKRYLRLNQP